MHKRLIVVMAVLCVAFLTPTPVEATGPWTVFVHRIGTPTWKPVDFNVFSAPIGTAATGYAEYFETVLSLLPRHEFHPELGVGPDPAQPHQRPYLHEMSTGVGQSDFVTSRRFEVEDFSNGQAVIAAWMVVPRGTQHIGSSPDFASGPIIPHSLFPIHVTGVTSRYGEVFSAPFAYDVPALDQVDPPFLVDGHSHFPFFLAENADFGPPGAELPGVYTFDVTMTDNTGAGWTIKVRFTVRSPH